MMESPVIAENLETKHTAPTKVSCLDSILWTSRNITPEMNTIPKSLQGHINFQIFSVPKTEDQIQDTHCCDSEERL